MAYRAHPHWPPHFFIGAVGSASVMNKPMGGRYRYHVRSTRPPTPALAPTTGLPSGTPLPRAFSRVPSIPIQMNAYHPASQSYGCMRACSCRPYFFCNRGANQCVGLIQNQWGSVPRNLKDYTSTHEDAISDDTATASFENSARGGPQDDQRLS